MSDCSRNKINRQNATQGGGVVGSDERLAQYFNKGCLNPGIGNMCQIMKAAALHNVSSMQT